MAPRGEGRFQRPTSDLTPRSTLAIRELPRLMRPSASTASNPFGWDAQCDVLVVGFGAAGACAAIEAADAGAIRHRHRPLSAAAARAPRAAASCMRAAALDSKKPPATTTRPTRCTSTCAWKSATPSIRATLRDFCDRSVEMIEWLEAHGVEFDSTVPPVQDLVSGRRLLPVFFRQRNR